jgi:hypothetical protein
MKFLPIFFVIALLTISCKQESQSQDTLLCSIAKSTVQSISNKLAQPWECSSEKIYDFLAQPLTDKICTREKGLIDLPSICKFGLGMIADLGESVVASKFSCNKEKINFKDISIVCNSL